LKPNAKEKEADLDFIKGEKDHTNPRFRKETKAPNQFTEATLLRHGNRRETGG
jgi:hypothetical protein